MTSLEEAFVFCWCSFADEHNTLPKSTRKNVKWNKFAFGTARLPDLLNINLRHQYEFFVAESQTFLFAKHPHRCGFRRLAKRQTSIKEME